MTVTTYKPVPKTLAAIFNEALTLDTQKAQAEFLDKRKTNEMKWYVKTFYGNDFSEYQIPTYKPNDKDPSICYLNMRRASSLFDVCIKFHKSNNTKRYENKMLIILEELPAEEAELIVEMLKGEERIIAKVWKKVFPEFFRD